VDGVDFDVTLEFQGADELIPALPGTPTDTLGLTAWSTDVNTIDTKRFVRWRFRFFVADSYPAFGLGALPMPAVLDLIIPYES